MLSKSLIQFSVDGRGCVPSLLFDLRPNYGGVHEDNGDLLQKVQCRHCHTQCPRLCSRPPTPPQVTPGHSQASLDQPLVGLLLLKQIRYNYKLEVTNRFKGLDLIDRVP